MYNVYHNRPSFYMYQLIYHITHITYTMYMRPSIHRNHVFGKHAKVLHTKCVSLIHAHGVLRQVVAVTDIPGYVKHILIRINIKRILIRVTRHNRTGYAYEEYIHI